MHDTRTAGLFAVAIAALLMFQPARAIERGVSEGGRLYLMGGIGAEEAAGMAVAQENFALSVITTVKGSGAYIADAHMRIVDEQGRVVFDRVLNGPWLLIDLPLGRFTVEASYRGERQVHTTTIHQGDHHQIVCAFSVRDP